MEYYECPLAKLPYNYPNNNLIPTCEENYLSEQDELRLLQPTRGTIDYSDCPLPF